MIVSCVALVMTTNRMYGQPTFFSPQSGSSSSVDEKGCCASTNSSTSRASRERTATSTGNVFGRVPEFGVLEVILSFLSPADLVGTEAVSTTFRRSSIAEHLWKQHCARTFSPLAQLGGARCQEQQQEEHQHRHVRHQHMPQRKDEDEEEEEEGWGGSGRFRPSKACCSSCCPISSGRGGYHEATDSGLPLACSTTTSRTTGDARRSGSCGRNGSNGPPSPSSLSRSCCDRAGYHCPWREAFFRAHRARPRDLLRELSSSLPSNVNIQQPPSQPAPEQQCIIVLHGNVYELAGFLSSHPGGALILQEHASTDATEAFERFFHSREARRMARRFVVWDGEAVMGRKGTLWRFARQGIST
ncbi:unnamed protein product [Ectocarpus sp. CCAP 1310/34]|nr:unnamed protein product [Ectocarpus sp. CCAP 1310/34]